MNYGKCPKCEQYINNVNTESVDVSVNLTPKYLGVSYLCPLCNTVLSVGIDPLALKTDIVSGIAGILRQNR